jgi:uncharacterized membrane protein YbaN (DUF454 family)
MKKKLRIALGGLLAIFGVVFFILPGSILVLLAGLWMLSYDVPRARDWLRTCQKVMSKSASKLDKLILDKRLRR